jgi:hypothetical protein
VFSRQRPKPGRSQRGRESVDARWSALRRGFDR